MCHGNAFFPCNLYDNMNLTILVKLTLRLSKISIIIDDFNVML